MLLIPLVSPGLPEVFQHEVADVCFQKSRADVLVRGEGSKAGEGGAIWVPVALWPCRASKVPLRMKGSSKTCHDEHSS